MSRSGVGQVWSWFGTRGLRFRLTVSYAGFFSLLLIALGFVFRQTLSYTLDVRMREVLEEEWGAVKGYLRIEKGQPKWYYDADDSEEAAIVERLRRMLLLTDASGKVLEASNGYRALGFDTSADVQEALRSRQASVRVRTDDYGERVMIRSGILIDGGRSFYLAMGLPLTDNENVTAQFTRNYFMLLPFMIAGASLLGWFLAGRVIAPLNDVALTAKRISGSNLNLRIPRRPAADELDNLIQAFNGMVERLESSFEQIRRFSTDVSHELRTPLTAIRGQLEVALFTASTEDQYRDAMVNALEDVERLSQIVRALLLLSQAESGQLALQRASLDLSETAKDVAEQFQIPAEAGRVTLSVTAPGQIVIDADRVQIERLISNLLSNALKHTPAGGRVDVRLASRNGLVDLSVEDTGEGIGQEHLPHIFDRFYRVNPAEPSPEKGLGLGLSFVAWIARAHGGTVNVESTPGRGSRFTVSLPALTTSPVPGETRERTNAVH